MIQSNELIEVARLLDVHPSWIRQELESNDPMRRDSVAQRIQRALVIKAQQRQRASEQNLPFRERVELSRVDRALRDLQNDPIYRLPDGSFDRSAAGALDELRAKRQGILESIPPPPKIGDMYQQEVVEKGPVVMARNPRGWQAIVKPKDLQPPTPPEPQGPTADDFNKLVMEIVKAQSTPEKPYPMQQARMDALAQMRFFDVLTGKAPVPPSGGRGRSVPRAPMAAPKKDNRSDLLLGVAKTQPIPVDPSTWSVESLAQAKPLARRILATGKGTPDERRWMNLILSQSNRKSGLQNQIAQASQAVLKIASRQSKPDDPTTWKDTDVLGAADDAGAIIAAVQNLYENTPREQIPPAVMSAYRSALAVARQAESTAFRNAPLTASAGASRQLDAYSAQYGNDPDNWPLDIKRQAAVNAQQVLVELNRRFPAGPGSMSSDSAKLWGEMNKIVEAERTGTITSTEIELDTMDMMSVWDRKGRQIENWSQDDRDIAYSEARRIIGRFGRPSVAPALTHEQRQALKNAQEVKGRIDNMRSERQKATETEVEFQRATGPEFRRMSDIELEQAAKVAESRIGQITRGEADVTDREVAVAEAQRVVDASAGRKRQREIEKRIEAIGRQVKADPDKLTDDVKAELEDLQAELMALKEKGL